MPAKDDDDRIFSHGSVEGYIRKDSFGRTFIDRCASDEEHLAAARAPVGQERPGCRKYLEDLVVPELILGKNVKLRYEVFIETKKEN